MEVAERARSFIDVDFQVLEMPVQRPPRGDAPAAADTDRGQDAEGGTALADATGLDLRERLCLSQVDTAAHGELQIVRLPERPAIDQAHHAPVEGRRDAVTGVEGLVAEVDAPVEHGLAVAFETEVVDSQAVPVTHPESEFEAALVHLVVEAQVILGAEGSAGRARIAVEAALGGDRSVRVRGAQCEAVVERACRAALGRPRLPRAQAAQRQCTQSMDRDDSHSRLPVVLAWR